MRVQTWHGRLARAPSAARINGIWGPASPQRQSRGAGRGRRWGSATPDGARYLAEIPIDYDFDAGADRCSLRVDGGEVDPRAVRADLGRAGAGHELVLTLDRILVLHDFERGGPDLFSGTTCIEMVRTLLAMDAALAIELFVEIASRARKRRVASRELVLETSARGPAPAARTVVLDELSGGGGRGRHARLPWAGRPR